MKMTHRLRKLGRDFRQDQDGVVATEYVIMLTFLIVAFLWLNTVTNTILFGASPYVTEHAKDPRADRLIPPDNSTLRPWEPGPDDLETEKWLLEYVAGNSPVVELSDNQHDRAYLSQIYIHLSRP